MSIYESITRSSLLVKRRLFDFNVSIMGQSMKAIKISTTEDIFHDTTIDSTLESTVIEAIIRLPNEMPLDRYRLKDTTQVEESRTYFYDLLPIEGYTKLSDHLEKNDFLFFFLEDEQFNKIPYLLQITDTFGKFEIGLVWKKLYFAPYHGKLTQDIIQHLEEFAIHTFYDEYKIDNPDDKYLATPDEMSTYTSEAFTNLFPYPLQPINRTITLDAGNYVAQCASGSFFINSLLITVDSPRGFNLESSEALELIPNTDCRFPSIYLSNFFHPFVYDNKEAYYISRPLINGTYNFKLDLVITEKSGINAIIFYDVDHTLLEDDASILANPSSTEYNPILYIEDGSGKYLLLKINSSLEIIVEGFIDSVFTNNFGIFTNTHIQLSFTLDSDTIIIQIDGISYSITGCSVFNNKELNFGYEPDRYLNDFIKQVYN